MRGPSALLAFFLLILGAGCASTPTPADPPPRRGESPPAGEEPATPADSALARGRERLAAGDRVGAAAAFEEAIAAGDEVWARLALAEIRRAEGRADEALSLLDDAVAARPDLAQARLQRALAREGRGDLRGAVSDLRSLTERAPTFASGYLRLGRILGRLGERAEAAAAYARAMALDPFSVDAALALAELLEEVRDPHAPAIWEEVLSRAEDREGSEAAIQRAREALARYRIDLPEEAALHLARVVRAAACGASAATLADLEEDAPAALEASFASSLVLATLRSPQGGVLRGHGEGATLFAAAEVAGGRLSVAGGLTPDAVEEGVLVIDVATGPPVACRVDEGRGGAEIRGAAFEPGADALAVTVRGQTFYLFPLDPLFEGAPSLDGALALVCRRAGLAAGAWREAGARIGRFETIEYLAFPGEGAVRAYRGAVLPARVEPRDLLDAAEAAATWLAGAQWLPDREAVSGALLAGFDPVRNQAIRDPLPGPAERAEAARSIALVARVRSNRVLALAARGLLAPLLAARVETPDGPRLADDRGEPLPVAVQAVALSALLELWAMDRSQPRTFDDLARALVPAARSGDPEALRALAERAIATGDPAGLDDIAAGSRAVEIGDPLAPGADPGAIRARAIALERAIEACGGSDLDASRLAGCAGPLAGRCRGPQGVPPDRVGGIGWGPEGGVADCASTALAGELLAAARRVRPSSGANGGDRLPAALRLAGFYLLCRQTRAADADVFGFIAPGRSVGGFRRSPTDPTYGTADAALAIPALLGAAEALSAEK